MKSVFLLVSDALNDGSDAVPGRRFWDGNEFGHLRHAAMGFASADAAATERASRISPDYGDVAQIIEYSADDIQDERLAKWSYYGFICGGITGFLLCMVLLTVLINNGAGRLLAQGAATMVIAALVPSLFFFICVAGGGRIGKYIGTTAAHRANAQQ